MSGTHVFKCALLCSAAAFAMPALAQETADESQQEETGRELAFEAVIVTGVAGPTRILDSSVSTSSLDLDEALQAAPRSTAEIFRNIPGIRSEATSGESNANITIRGVPISGGGARYVQLHEDGLPVLEFGDIAFGTADSFLRADYNIARVEAIRGGSASTFASNSPAGVINLISKTGEEEGGAIGVTFGLDYESYRADFDFGGELGENWLFHVGGFYRDGEGPRDIGFNGNTGGQIKANLTRLFENGYARLNFKHLNDRTVTYLPIPTLVTGNDGSVGEIPGFDVESQTLQSIFLSNNLGLDGANNPRLGELDDGVRALSTAIGGEFDFDLDGGWNVAAKFRYSDNEGSFFAPFPAFVDDAGAVATAQGEALGGTGAGLGAFFEFANGPFAGQAFGANGNTLNNLVTGIVVFDVDVGSLDNLSGDLRISREMDFGNAVATLTGGIYVANQRIEQNWNFSSYFSEVRGDNAALLNLIDGNGVTQTDNGRVSTGATFFGNCCRRSIDAEYDVLAPFANLNVEAGNLTVDASLRYDSGDAAGLTFGDGPVAGGIDVDGDGVISVSETRATVLPLNDPFNFSYDYDYWSWSIGANYRLTDALAVFGRASQGGRANADRILFVPTNFTAGGNIADEGIAFDTVDQYEAGVKWRYGDLSLFATGFFAETDESAGFEATTQAVLEQSFRAGGIELEYAYTWNGFFSNGGVTWTDAEITGSNTAAEVGNTPRRQADWIYQFTSGYDFSDHNVPASVGFNVIGTSDSFAQNNNDLELGGYAFVNLFAEYELTSGLSLALNVNNLFDAFGISESEEGSLPANGLIRARGINGRTTSLTLRYAF